MCARVCEDYYWNKYFENFCLERDVPQIVVKIQHQHCYKTLTVVTFIRCHGGQRGRQIGKVFLERFPREEISGEIK